VTSPDAPDSRASSTGTLRIVVPVVAVLSLLVAGVAVAVLNLSAQVRPAYGAVVAPAPSAAVAARADRGSSQASRSSARSVVDPAWVTRNARSAGIPGPALRAYADAELTVRVEQPGCHLGWNTLAGLGWVESQHGTLGGRTLQADGRSSTPIVGPALDGSRDFAAIRATRDSARWHGDSVWEHAVGPLQFLPSTWARWGADGDGDGHTDPRDLDDAALAAGRYLCADAHDLTSDDGWSAAVHSYNHDARYVADVAAAASTYVARTR
jgi:membrane-bound lytic murein transglycosylase B